MHFLRKQISRHKEDIIEFCLKNGTDTKYLGTKDCKGEADPENDACLAEKGAAPAQTCDNEAVYHSIREAAEVEAFERRLTLISSPKR